MKRDPLPDPVFIARLAVWSPIEQLQTVISGSLIRDAARTCELLRDGGLDKVDGLLNRTEVFLFGVGDFDVESVFERERHFNRRQAVGTEIFNKGGFVLDVLFLDASRSAMIFLTFCSISSI